MDASTMTEPIPEEELKPPSHRPIPPIVSKMLQQRFEDNVELLRNMPPVVRQVRAAAKSGDELLGPLVWELNDLANISDMLDAKLKIDIISLNRWLCTIFDPEEKSLEATQSDEKPIQDSEDTLTNTGELTCQNNTDKPHNKIVEDTKKSSTPTTPEKSVKLPDPERFYGGGIEEFKTWRDQVRIKMEGNADRFITESEKTLYAMMSLRGQPAVIAYDLYREDPDLHWVSVIDALQLIYGEPEVKNL